MDGERFLWNKEFALEQVGNDPLLLQQLLEIARRSLSSLAAGLKEAVTEGDHARAAELAHSIKGSAANIGLVSVFNLSRSMEERIKAKNPERLAAMASELCAQVERFCSLTQGG